MERGTPVSRNYKSGRLVVLGLLLFAAALAVVAVIGGPRISLRRQSPEETAALAALPFRNLSGDPELEVLASELAPSLSKALASTRRVSIVGAQRASAFDLDRRGIEEAAKSLGADYVIAGSVDENDGRILVDAYLFRAAPEPALWVERLSWEESRKSRIASELAERIRSAVMWRR